MFYSKQRTKQVCPAGVHKTVCIYIAKFMGIVRRVEVCEPGTLMQASYNVTAKRALNAMHNERTIRGHNNTVTVSTVVRIVRFEIKFVK